MIILLYIFGILIGIILLLLIIFFSLPVSITFFYKEKLTFKFKIAGIGYDPLKKNKNKGINENEKTKTMEAKPSIRNFLEFVNTARDVVRNLPYRIKVNKLFLKIIVAGEDAAIVAIEYGAVCSVVHSLVAFLQNYLNFEKPDILIIPGFEEKKSCVEFESIISTFAGNIILAYLRHKLYAKFKIKIKVGANK